MRSFYKNKNIYIEYKQMTSENITLETGEPHIIMDKQTQQKEVGELTKTKIIKILIKG